MPEYEFLSALTDRQRDRLLCHDLMRWLSCAALTLPRGGTLQQTGDVFLTRFPRALHAPTLRNALIDFDTKAATLAGDPTTWGAAIGVAPPVDALMKLVRAESLLGRIVGARRVPFDASVPRQIGATGSFYWSAPGAPKPATALSFDSLSLPQGKISGIIALSLELVRLSVPNAESAMVDALVGACALFQDAQLVDPAVALIGPSTRPASITNGLTPVTSTGSGLAADVAKTLGALYTSCPSCQKPTLLMSPANAGALAAASQQPQLTVTGGFAFGVPTVTSAGCGKQVVALDAGGLAYADAGMEVDISTQALVEMNDAPTGTAASVMTSFWQMNLAGIRVERRLWYVQTPGSVQLLTTP